MKPSELAEFAIMGRGALQKPEELTAAIEFIELKLPSVKSVLEIGSCNGGTFWVWAKIAGYFATLASIDLPGGPFGGGGDGKAEARMRDALEYDEKGYFYQGDSHDQKAFDWAWTVNSGKYDLVFIDGDHSYSGVKMDFELYSGIVAPGGLLLFHDITEHPPETGCEVKKFWDEIKEGRKYTEIIYPPTNWGGLGFLEF